MSGPSQADADSMVRALGTTRFNRLCRLVGLIVLLTATVVVNRRSPIYGDFVQFQMAGLIDRGGAWDALYPVPNPDSVHNAGSVKDSTAKPHADEIAISHGIDFVPYHFILPPPAALVFWPFGYIVGPSAHDLWLTASVVAGWIAAIQAGMILQRCAGRKTRWAGIITLLIACMPAMRRAVLVANLTPMIAATVGWAVLALMNEEQDFPSAAAIVLGSVMKYASAVLLPIVIVQRRWRTLGWAAALSVVWCSLTVAIVGTGPFDEFVTSIAPTLTRSHEMPDNICLAGVLLHVLHIMPPLPGTVSLMLSMARLAVLVAILVPMIRLGRHRMCEPAAVCATAMALLGWLLFFSPVAWSHYLIYLCPLWGWLACPSDKSRRTQILGWVAMGLVILSPDQMPPPAIDPWGIHLLLSLGLMLSLAVTQLYRWSPVRSVNEHLEIAAVWSRRKMRNTDQPVFARIITN